MESFALFVDPKEENSDLIEILFSEEPATTYNSAFRIEFLYHFFRELLVKCILALVHEHLTKHKLG